MKAVQSKRIQYTPSTFARTSLLHLSETGSLTALQPHTSARENLGGYLLMVVEAGCGLVKVGRKEYEMKVGDVAFIDCSKPYSHRTSEDLWTISWCHFNGPSLSLIYSKFLERSGRKPIFHATDIASYLSALQQLYDVAAGASFTRDMQINTLLSMLLEKIMADCWSEESKGTVQDKVDLTEVREYIEKHYREKIGLEELANQFFVEKTYLSRAFKLQFGINLFDYLHLIRINKVKELLRFGDDGRMMKLAEIAEVTGFGSESYLSLRFKKTEGISPSEYREKWK